VALDPNVRPSLVGDRPSFLARFGSWASLAAIVKASFEDLEWLFPELQPECRARSLLSKGPDGGGAELVIETRGGEGAVAHTPRFELRVPAFKVKVADTIGAGDTFHAALLHRLDAAGVSSRAALRELGQTELRDILVFAQAAAALDCTRTGAQPPDLAEVRAFLGSEA
jgi:fructokinase